MTLVRFNPGDIVVKDEKVGVSTWTNNQNNLSSLHSSSVQNENTPTSSRAFFVEAYQIDPSGSQSEVQLALSYGNKAGSGSQDFTNDVGSIGLSAARTVYGQYRQLVFGDETQNFTFDKHTPNDIYVINVERARFKHNLKPGSLNLTISGSSHSSIGLPAGRKDIHLTDDSVTSTGSAVVTNLGRQFNIVSGSNGIALGGTISQINTSASYGLFYPDAGVIILNPDAFEGMILPARNTGVSSNTDLNHRKLQQSISGAAHFIVDSQEKVTSQYYFTRAKNNEFNYTTNPSFVDANGNVNVNSFIDNPQTFITTIGLYNDNNDLVAVAKLSQPVTKDFTKEALIRVKLDY